MPGRKFTAGTGYRYGFNGKEKDKETTGTSTYDYGFRIYSPSLSKFLSVDPLAKSYPWYTPYQFAGNKPIIAIDLDGLEEKIVILQSIKAEKPAIQTESAIGAISRATVYTDAMNGNINLLEMQEIKAPKAPPSAIEFGIRGEFLPT